MIARVCGMRAGLLLVVAASVSAPPAAAQRVPHRIVVEPASLSLRVGETAALRVVAYDGAGEVIVEPALRFAAPRGALRARHGQVTAETAGDYEIAISAAISAEGGEPAVVVVPVHVVWPAVARVAIQPAPGRQLRLEREILAKAAAWFARETDAVPGKSSHS